MPKILMKLHELYAQKKMIYINKSNLLLGRHRALRDGLSLMEMVIALAIMTIIFAAILPLFGQIRNGWEIKQAVGETLQNGRVLIDHINHNLVKAVKITSVSDSSVTNGYIEFENNDANTFRYDVNSTSGYVEYGPIGSLSDLAGPVNQLKFTCYDPCDLDTPITDVNSIRFIKVETQLTDPLGLGKNMALMTCTYLHINPESGAQESLIKSDLFDYQIDQAETPALAQIDSNHYLCAYTGPGSDGWAVVLVIDVDNGTISEATAFEFDDVQATTPALAKIDNTHYLCVYTDKFSDGQVVVLTVNTGTWEITKQTTFEYDTDQALTPALAKINDTHYLCVYTDKFSDGQAVVLTVNTGTWEISKETPFEYDTDNADTPALAKIDNQHYLCAFVDKFSDGQVVVLTVNTGNWTISKGTTLEYDTLNGQNPFLTQIDSNHYLCAYTGDSSTGRAVILTIDSDTWTISAGTKLQFEDSSCDNPALAQIDTTNYLCAYSGSGADGWACVLSVDTDTWTISEGASLEYDTTQGTNPALAQVDTDNVLCLYEDFVSDGQAFLMTYNPAAGPPVSP
jgi:prepilin-type N-terminal cleavage/methylation domain-containing protein